MTATRVCSVADVAEGEARRFDVAGLRICVVHLPDADDGRHGWYAIGDECSHADFSLSEGDVWADECEIECPKHGSTFSLTTGEPHTLPATRPVATYELVLEGDDVMVVPT
ncbi:MAG: non-heme iron oxygenase ferredoxin subunit [Acidimicrobiia bacterium]|nr:non-heme iron oxygenase ferredoxin subunit [Acidimicrobiia bacterium]